MSMAASSVDPSASGTSRAVGSLATGVTPSGSFDQSAWPVRSIMYIGPPRRARMFAEYSAKSLFAETAKTGPSQVQICGTRSATVLPLPGPPKIATWLRLGARPITSPFLFVWKPM